MSQLADMTGGENDSYTYIHTQRDTHKMFVEEQLTTTYGDD